MESVDKIRSEFEKIKNNKFLNSQSKSERLKCNPFKFFYIYVWQKILSLLIYNLNFKKPLCLVKTFWGEKIQMILPRPSFLYFFGFLGKSELYLTNYLIKNLKSGQIFIDGGANIGFYSLLASNLVGESGCVYAFEPNKDVFPILLSNLHLKSNVTSNESGLWKKSGGTLFVNSSLENNLYGTIDDSLRNQHDKPSLKIQTVSLDDYCSKNNIVPSIIKLDTEGSEFDILIGSVGIISKHHPVIVLEILKETVLNGTYEKITSFLKPYSYSCYQLTGDYSEKKILEIKDIDPTFYNFVFK